MKELAALISLKDTCKSSELYSSLKNTVTCAQQRKLSVCVSVVTRGCICSVSQQ
jgi:hypothetical protein